MKMFQRLLVLGLLICGTAYLAGCGEQKPADNGAPPATDTGSSDAGHDEHADHEHADHEEGDHEEGEHNEEASDGGTAATSDSEEFQLVSLKLPNMT